MISKLVQTVEAVVEIGKVMVRVVGTKSAVAVGEVRIQYRSSHLTYINGTSHTVYYVMLVILNSYATKIYYY